MKNITNSLPQNGSILLPFVILVPFLILIVASFMELGVASLGQARGDQYRSYAQLAADSGADVGVQEMNANNSWVGSITEIELHNDGKIRTTYAVTAITNSATSKTITATGRSYSPVSNSTPKSSIKVSVELRPVSSGEYSVVSGVGGLIMTNSARILGGDVFINGKVSLSNSAQIGLTTNPVNLEVAHQSCPNPADATYARLCNSGENGQPISLLNTSRIYGNVKANNQTNGTSMTNPGLTAGSGVAAQALPNHDRAAQKAAVTSTVTGASASCSSGTQTWAGNLRITGDVFISNSCRVTVNGNIWITGKLELKNSAEMIVAASVGAVRPVIMIDGLDATFNNNSLLRSNASNTGFQIITYRSDALCSPDCLNVTGTDLFNSQDDTSIQLDNSAAGPNTIFYARWSKVVVKNSGQIGALIGQTVELNNSGTITFGASTGTGTTFWVVDGYRRVF